MVPWRWNSPMDAMVMEISNCFVLYGLWYGAHNILVHDPPLCQPFSPCQGIGVSAGGWPTRVEGCPAQASFITWKTTPILGPGPRRGRIPGRRWNIFWNALSHPAFGGWDSPPPGGQGCNGEEVWHPHLSALPVYPVIHLKTLKHAIFLQFWLAHFQKK